MVLLLALNFFKSLYSPPVSKISASHRLFVFATAEVAVRTNIFTSAFNLRPSSARHYSPHYYASAASPVTSSIARRRNIMTSRVAAAAASEASESPSAAAEKLFHPNLRGVFAGSGVEAFSDPSMAEVILGLLPPDKRGEKKIASVNILYLGTATYDLPIYRAKQTKCFVDRGCAVRSLDVAHFDDIETKGSNDSSGDYASAVENADIIIVSGGNTLYAVDRWNHVGLTPLLRKAMDRGCIMTGGSAGAICWFDSGHSDSMDSDSYRTAMLQEQEGKTGSDKKTVSCSSSFDASRGDVKKEWKYVRVPGLGFVPGLVCCPHHDLTQSNGVLRATDFDDMLLRMAVDLNKSEPTVVGIGIDHYAALVVEGDNRYRVFTFDGKPGSVSHDGRSLSMDEHGKPTGRPGIWIKRVAAVEDGADNIGEKKDPDDGSRGGKEKKRRFVIEAKVIPTEGKLQDIIMEDANGTSDMTGITRQTFFGDGRDSGVDVDVDNMRQVELCRKENPSS